MTCGCDDVKDFCVNAGETFHPAIRWGLSELVTAAITGITQAAPVVITAPAHGVPDGWPVAIVSVKGMASINAGRYPPAANDYHRATVLAVDTLALNDINSADYPAYLLSGYVVYQQPVDLTGYAATMTFWDTQAKGTVLETLTIGAGLTVDTVGHTITPELQTAGLAWATSYYELAMTATDGIVSQILRGQITINP